MERKETRRERRMRDRDRMIARGQRQASVWYPRPLVEPSRFTWTDLNGDERRGLPTWEDVFDIRYQHGRTCADHLATCSCWMCGNPRRWHRSVTWKEYRAALEAREQYLENDLPFSVRVPRTY